MSEVVVDDAMVDRAMRFRGGFGQLEEADIANKSLRETYRKWLMAALTPPAEPKTEVTPAMSVAGQELLEGALRYDIRVDATVLILPKHLVVDDIHRAMHAARPEPPIRYCRSCGGTQVAEWPYGTSKPSIIPRDRLRGQEIVRHQRKTDNPLAEPLRFHRRSGDPS